MLKLSLSDSAYRWEPVLDSISSGLQDLAWRDAQAGYDMGRDAYDIAEWAWLFAHDRSILLPDVRMDSMLNCVTNWFDWYRHELNRYTLQLAE